MFKQWPASSSETWFFNSVFDSSNTSINSRLLNQRNPSEQRPDFSTKSSMSSAIESTWLFTTTKNSFFHQHYSFNWSSIFLNQLSHLTDNWFWTSTWFSNQVQFLNILPRLKSYLFSFQPQTSSSKNVQPWQSEPEIADLKATEWRLQTWGTTLWLRVRSYVYSRGWYPTVSSEDPSLTLAPGFCVCISRLAMATNATHTH